MNDLFRAQPVIRARLFNYEVIDNRLIVAQFEKRVATVEVIAGVEIRQTHNIVEFFKVARRFKRGYKSPQQRQYHYERIDHKHRKKQNENDLCRDFLFVRSD